LVFHSSTITHGFTEPEILFLCSISARFFFVSSLVTTVVHVI